MTVFLSKKLLIGANYCQQLGNIKCRTAAAVMELTADQSNYGPVRELNGAQGGMERGVCRPQGTGEWRVPGSWATNCHCWAVISFGVDHGAELPLPSRLGAGDVI